MCKTCGCHGGKNEQLKLTVEGMSCNHCKLAVEKAVRALPGVMAAEVDLAAKTLTADYDPAKSTLDDVKQAIADAGFKAV